MPLADRVVVSRRFQLAIRVDTDVDDPTALEGFVCPKSSAHVLETVAQHLRETGHGAFTWTGPYGSGKSSLVIALSALLGRDSTMRLNAAAQVGIDTAKLVWEAMPPGSNGWQVLAVVGRRERPEQLIGEAVNEKRLARGRGRRRRNWTEKQALDALWVIANRDLELGGGLIVFIDEMGKILEGSARDGSDVHFFQQLAEMASPSNGRLILVGILHQAFEEYSHRLSREMREEWSKIQGRFVDLPVNAGPDEQITLLGRAIEPGPIPKEHGNLAKAVASMINRPSADDLAWLLENCWPLHPIVACQLGPISRRRFGQNQRSIFGFLNSSEPAGFQEFLRRAEEPELYPPHQLWEYLRLNLEPSIMASPDGHRWALAVEAIERCQALGGQDLHLRLLKTIALVDMFKERSGLVPSAEVLSTALLGFEKGTVAGALTQLQDWSLIIYRKFNESYSIFEGSDFDIDEEVGKALEDIEVVDFSRLNSIADLRPVVAKRHYHETGAMRWFDVAMAPLAEVRENPEGFRPRRGGVGTFLMAVPTQSESNSEELESASHAVNQAKDWDFVVGVPQGGWNITSLARELLATEQVRDGSPELQGDRVARREVEGRIVSLRGYLESELSRVFDSALWLARDQKGERLTSAQLNGLASDLADKRFSETPHIQNELLNRVKPSGNAVAALNALLRRMVQQEGVERLGINGFPAEGGLFNSLLERSRLYRETSQGWKFVDPASQGDDPCNLAPAWRAATEVLRSKSHRAVPVSEIYDVWREKPFGIKGGLLPVLATAFILSQWRHLAFYRQGVFQARVTDLDIDYLTKDPLDIQIRWMDLSESSRQLLSDMAGIVRNLDGENTLSNLEPIDVAKGLVSIYDQLPAWVGRTQRLSSNAKRVRQLFKQASDPNRLIFDDIPQSLSEGMVSDEGIDLQAITKNVSEGLQELQQAYPAMLNRLRETLLSELQVPNASPPMLAELRARAENIRELTGDYRMEAFVMRLSQFSGTNADVESLASMIANKPARSWVDTDIDSATVELAEMARRFLRAESFAHVRGRDDKRHSMAVTVGMSGRPATLWEEFDVNYLERPEVEALVGQLKHALDSAGEDRRNVILAALAELSAQYLSGSEEHDLMNRSEAEKVVQ